MAELCRQWNRAEDWLMEHRAVMVTQITCQIMFFFFCCFIYLCFCLSPPLIFTDLN